jgi:alpha-tubulin suppressor-like RCC1 family protein
VGDHHTLVRTADGTLLAFGKNAEGQLGLGRRAFGQVSVPQPSSVRWSE